MRICKLCVYRITIYLKSKHLRHFIVNSLLMPSRGKFFSTRFKLKLFGKQYALNRQQKMRCLYYSVSQTVTLKVLWILFNKGYNMLKQYKKSAVISQPMKSLCAHNVIYGLPLSRFWRLYFFERNSKNKIWYPVKLFDIWGSRNCNLSKKIEAKILRYGFAKHEIAKRKHVSHGNRKEMKMKTPKFS